MATDPPPDARHSAPAPRSDDPASDLVAQVHNYSRAVIEAELRRLARRAPSLRPNDLEVIDAALDELVESLLLARLRSLPQHTARLKHLFSTAREDPCRVPIGPPPRRSGAPATIGPRRGMVER